MILRTMFFVAVTAPSIGIHAADLVTPPMTHEAPAAGKRVWQQAPEYRGTNVYHSLYLPRNWIPGKNTLSLLNTPETSFYRDGEVAK